jgi:hypothetical protein
MDRVELVEKRAKRRRARPTREAIEIRPERKDGRQSSPARVLAPDLERLRVERRPQRDKRRLHTRRPHALVEPNPQGVMILGSMHDDEVGADALRGHQDDLRQRGAYSLRAVVLTCRPSRRRSIGTGEEQGGSERFRARGAPAVIR